MWSKNYPLLKITPKMWVVFGTMFYSTFWSNFYSLKFTVCVSDLLHFLITRVKAGVIISLFAQDLFSHAATLDFGQSLQIVEACEYL